MTSSNALVAERADGTEEPHRPGGRAARYGKLLLWRGLLPALPGVLVFLALYWPMLDPRRIPWIFGPSAATFDVATSQLAWFYYAQDDWRWPLGSNPSYGGNIADSLLFTDSLPAFAVLLKLVVKVADVSRPLQMIGLSLLLCSVLQSVLSYAVVRAWRGTRSSAFLGACFIALAPALMHWWNVMSLYWQWPILAGLLVASTPLRSAPRLLSWVGLVFLTTGITPYITLMLLVLGSLDLLVRARTCPDRRLLLAGIPAMAVSTLVGLYTWGAFSLSAGAAITGGFGEFAANTTALLDSGGKSLFVADLAGGTASGYAYIGAGLLLLLVAGAGIVLRLLASEPTTARWAAARRAFRPSAIALALGCALLAVAAFLPNISVGVYSLALPLPERVVGVLSSFRANGRFIWPLMYAVMLAAVCLVARVVPGRGAVALLTLALGLQVVDLIPFTGLVRGQVQEVVAADPRMQDELSAAFEAPGVEAVEVVPAYPHPPEVPWREVGLAAFLSGLRLDSLGYFNRYDTAAILAQREAQLADLAAGDLRSDTVYVLSRPLFDQFSIGERSKVLLTVDDWVVLRPSDTSVDRARAGLGPPVVRPTAGFGQQETDATGAHGWWLTAPSGRVEVSGPPLSTVRVALSVVAPPCGQVRATFADRQVSVGRGARATVELDVPVAPDGRGAVPVQASSVSCTPAGDERTLYLLVYEPTATPVS